MILAVMIAYQIFAVGLLVLIGWLAVRKNRRELTALTDRLIADMRQRHGAVSSLDPLPPLVESPECVPASVSDEDELSATGDAAKLQAEYAATIAGLQALLREMADAGYPVGPERVTADVFAREAV